MHDALFSIARALNITRPLFAFDVETTGVSVEEDRIVSIAWARVTPGPDYTVRESSTLVNPMRRIPKEASDVHGITDADVVGAPTFGQLVPTLVGLLAGCDLLAFNGRRFDAKLLAKELERAGMAVSAQGVLDAQILDPCIIFHRKEARDLTAALKFYCDRELGDDAHGAEADMAACVEVLAAQLVCYDDLPRSVEGLHDYCEDRQPHWVDKEGKVVWRDGEACISFGKYAGTSLKRLVAADQGFLTWILARDFSDEVKTIVRAALRRQFPTPPAGKVA